MSTPDADRHIYVAKAACGYVTAMCWDDPGYEASTAECVARYIKRGDTVSHELVPAGSLPPSFTPVCTGCTCWRGERA